VPCKLDRFCKWFTFDITIHGRSELTTLNDVGTRYKYQDNGGYSTRRNLRRVNCQTKGIGNQEEKSDRGGERFHDGKSDCEEFTFN
jgi:hypothetical protein